MPCLVFIHLSSLGHSSIPPHQQMIKQEAREAVEGAGDGVEGADVEVLMA